jgi:hypothetical protein
MPHPNTAQPHVLGMLGWGGVGRGGTRGWGRSRVFTHIDFDLHDLCSFEWIHTGSALELFALIYIGLTILVYRCMYSYV